MKAGAAIAVLACGLATPAAATEWVNCGDGTGTASFNYLAGTLDVLSIVGLTMSAGNASWASDPVYGPGEVVAVGQAFENEQMILVDAVDENITSVIARLRLFKAVDADGAPVYAGTLAIEGHGAWAVNCSGP